MTIRMRARWTALVVAMLWPGLAGAQDIKVTLLGTGNPNPGMTRFGPSTLVEANGHAFLFDAGRGALQRLTQIHVNWQSVDGVFLTHLHSDHVVGFPDLWLTGWLIAPGRHRPLDVWGPLGTKDMMTHLSEAFAFDIQIRESDDHADPEGAGIQVQEVAEGVVYDHDGVRITAFDVDHSPVRPAFGYRVDYHGRSVVLSGDTRVSENLVKYAKGVDLLVHEVVSADAIMRSGGNPEQLRSRINHHTSAEQAGDVFARTLPKLAVYSHIGPPGVTPQDLIPPARVRYAGPLEIGEDLMVIDVGETVEVRRATSPR